MGMEGKLFLVESLSGKLCKLYNVWKNRINRHIRAAVYVYPLSHASVDSRKQIVMYTVLWIHTPYSIRCRRDILVVPVTQAVTDLSDRNEGTNTPDMSNTVKPL